MDEYEDDELRDVTPWDAGLKPRYRTFVLEMATSELHWLDPGEAYKNVVKKKDKKTGKYTYPNRETCLVQGNRWYNKPEVKKALGRLLAEQQPELDEANVSKVLHHIAQLAFFNPADIIDNNGLLKKKLENMGDLAKCVKNITPTRYGNKVELEDRSKYLDMLGKYLQLVRPENTGDTKLQVIEVAAKIGSDELMDAVDKWNAIALKENE
ncbi:terminase small subunit [Treponema sp.]|uniref:terminase small subunit n=1 Tax=Treponema sp. TaxID=166 RepID=UPI00298D971A|nr:terminase small subunit [Treponema sp.]MCQ2242111.1 terminase small subunit [Treponema sp.]